MPVTENAGVLRSVLLTRHDGTEVPVTYTLLRRRRRTFGLKVTENGLVVSIPMRAPLRMADEVVTEKSRWILEKLSALEHWHESTGIAETVFRDGGRLSYRGRTLTLRTGGSGASPQIRLSEDGENFELRLSSAAVSESDIRSETEKWLYAEAVRIIEERFRYIAQFSPEQPVSVSLNSAVSLWGSCSAKRRIRLNWRLIFFDNDVIDYVIAHELAHLQEMNHSARFWDAVKRIKPNYERAEKILKKIRIKLLPL